MLGTTVEFEKQLVAISSNPDQLLAFNTTHNCVILAGPGSGKTKVLTLKVASLLRDSVKAPHRLACLTYNNECVREIAQRLERLGLLESGRFRVSTVHAFCLREVIGPFGHLVDATLAKLVVADESMADQFLTQAMENVGINQPLADWRVPITAFRRTCIERDLDSRWTPGDKALTDVTIEYERILAENNRLDFDGIVLRATELIREQEFIKRALRAKFPVIVIDEYQDLGAPLHRMVLELLRCGTRIIAVGDPDQSVYGFTGARPELLRELAALPSVEKIQLKANYRCPRLIVDAATAALGEPRDYKGVADAPDPIRVVECQSGIQQQATEAVKIVKKLAQSVPLERIAILYPSRNEGVRVEAALQSAAVPYVRRDSGVGYSRPPLVRLLEDLAAWSLEKGGAPRLSHLVSRWMLITGSHDRMTRVRLVRFLFSWRKKGAVALREWLESLRVTALVQVALSKDDLLALETLSELVNVGGTLEDLTVERFAQQEDSSSRARMMNLHTAKGTEYDHVIIVGLDEGRLPIWRAQKPEEFAEARRLFYVGITRAHKRVHLLFSGFTESPSSRRFYHGPSRYLVEVQDFLEGRGFKRVTRVSSA